MTSNSSQLGISALFASASMAPLLRLFMLDPEREYYQRELQRLTSVHLRQLQRDLARLEQSGLVESRSHGNRTYYRAAASHPAFADMRGLVLKTVGLGDVVRDALRSVEVAIDVAFIFGSFAAGDAAAGSDVDLLVVGSVSRRDLAVAVNAAAAELGRELNPVIFTCPEFAERWRADDHFVSTVLAGPRIWLIGDDTTPQRWLESGALRRHRASRQEVADLLDVVERDLGDARATVISLDRRFATTYSAALHLATVVLAASGYRAVAQRGHHAVTLQALPEIIGDGVRDLAIYLDSCRSLRNRGDYDRVGVVSASDVTELLDETASFRQQVLGWLSETHPELLADR